MNFFKYLAIVTWLEAPLPVSIWNHLQQELDDPEDIDSGRGLLRQLYLDDWAQAHVWLEAKTKARALLEQKISITYPGAFDYPSGLLQLDNPPSALSYWGRPVWLDLPCLSVVGTRRPSGETLQWLDVSLGELLVGHEMTLVSGGARGVDQKAHAMALRCHRPTVCFLPSGLESLYPVNLSSWKAPILAGGGALVSQFPPWQGMFKSHFIQRNRLIAAISRLTFVAEAARKSGSLLTAKFAMELGRPLATLPVSPMCIRGLGSLDLIFDGAYMVRDHRDLSQLLEQHL